MRQIWKGLKGRVPPPGRCESRPGLFYFPQYDIFIEVVHYASFVFPIPVSQGPKSEYNSEQEGIDVIVECSGKTSATGAASVAAYEAGDRCRCGQIGDIRLTWAVTCTWKACRRGGCFAGSILPTSAGKAFCRLPESCYLQNSAVRTVARGDKRRRRLIRLSGSWRPRGISVRPAARLRLR